jgi:hypothetical protein
MQSHLRLRLTADPRIERPRYVWVAVLLELICAVGAIPVGLMFIADPSGKAIGVPAGWIETTPFGSYLVPGLYLLVMNGLGMLLAAALSSLRQPLAPWLTGVLGTGLVIWILVQLVTMPETMPLLQGWFIASGLVLDAVALAWLRRTDQLRLW